MQKLRSLQSAGAEDRAALEARYRGRLAEMDARLKEVRCCACLLICRAQGAAVAHEWLDKKVQSLVLHLLQPMSRRLLFFQRTSFATKSWTCSCKLTLKPKLRPKLKPACVPVIALRSSALSTAGKCR